MKCSILTLFPSLVAPYFTESLMLRGVDAGIVVPEVVDIREYATDRHRTCDDYPYGGGPGMVLKTEPVSAALDAAVQPGSLVVLPSPSGIPFDQRMAEMLATEQHLVFVCGRYEGVDQRVIDRYVDMEVSLGDFVMSSGELASLVIVDTVARLLEGFIRAESLEQESFGGSTGWLEYPHYTRPEEYENQMVPEVLRNGNHRKIDTWRSIKRVEKTAALRPDLFSDRIVRQRRARSIQALRAVAGNKKKKGDEHERDQSD